MWFERGEVFTTVRVFDEFYDRGSSTFPLKCFSTDGVS